ncbi:MAG: DUF1800 domain-containing protein [Pirellulales bacterium]
MASNPTSMTLDEVDPGWAWAPYVPGAEQPWSRSLAAHLYRRAGFAASSAQLDEAVRCGPSEAVRLLLPGGAESETFRQEIDTLVQTILATGDSRHLAAVWVYRLLNTPEQLLEKTTLFWHGHFATSAEKVQDAELMLDQNKLFRRHALGDFAQLVHEMARDPAMLIYLDSATNRKAHPNENFARELLELFCLGEGNYTETDVQELARCFTGWEVQRGSYRFNRYQHDTGEKSILGQTGSFGGDEGVRVVLDQEAMPRYIVGKLIRYFVFDEPEPPPRLVEPLVIAFREGGLQIRPVVERILNSRLFFSMHAIGRKVRSPIELAIGLLRVVEGTANAVLLAAELTQLGHGLFYPPSVKGWDGGRAWINSSTLLGRANLVRKLLEDENTRFSDGSLGTFLVSHGIQQPEELVDWLQTLLIAIPLSGAVRQRLLQVYEDTTGDTSAKAAALIHAASTLPECQIA